MILCGSYPKSIASATFDQNFCQKKSTLLNVCNTFDKLLPKPIKLCGPYSKKISHQCHFWSEFPFRKKEKRHFKRFTTTLTNVCNTFDKSNYLSPHVCMYVINKFLVFPCCFPWIVLWWCELNEFWRWGFVLVWFWDFLVVLAIPLN